MIFPYFEGNHGQPTCLQYVPLCFFFLGRPVDADHHRNIAAREKRRALTPHVQNDAHLRRTCKTTHTYAARAKRRAFTPHVQNDAHLRRTYKTTHTYATRAKRRTLTPRVQKTTHIYAARAKQRSLTQTAIEISEFWRFRGRK